MKINSLSVLILLICWNLSLLAQAPLPGGVKDAKLWYAPELINDQGVFKNKLEDNQYFIFDSSNSLTNKDLLMNFNSIALFDETSTNLNIPFYLSESSKITVFTVYHPTDSLLDKTIWEIKKNDNSQLIHTTKRVADLDSKNYLNFVDRRIDIPVLSTYVQHKEKDSITISSLELLVGGNYSQDLPIVPYHGKLAEIIIFNRVLNPEEKLRIESYLSIKYGIPLSQETPTSYLNSLGEIIYDIDSNSKFSNNIIGIGKDSLSTLNQKQSTNSLRSGFPILGFGQFNESNIDNTSSIQNDQFILCGDNGSRSRFNKKTSGLLLNLEREWMVATTGQNINTYPSFLHFEKELLEEIPLEEGEIFWLTVDRSGTGKYPLGQVDFYPIENSLEDDKIQFSNILWDTDLSGKDLFTLSIGGKMIPKYWITPPTCFPETNGTLHIGVEGGSPPYSISIEKLDSNFKINQSIEDNRLVDFNDIPQGEFFLTISDNRNNIITETFFVQSDDAIEIDLADAYTMNLSNPILLNTNIQEDASIEWRGPNDFYANQQEISISSPGEYSLTIDFNGCLSHKKFQVNGYEKSNFKAVQLYPNPIERNAEFSLKINLYEPAPIKMSIHDNQGKNYLQRILDGSDFYFFNEKINQAGIYFITLESLGFLSTQKIIVE